MDGTSWYKIHLTHDQLAENAYRNIHGRFAIDKVRAGRQQGFALFDSAKEDGVRSQTLFLPPLAGQYCRELLADYSATRCDKPDADSLVPMPLLGNEADFEFWFS
jgi:hypothetical protein